MFKKLQWWIDPVARSGPEAMAVDEWLLNSVTVPLLRSYQWDGDWGSIGYFGKLKEAQEHFPGLNWVRRWTGGGTVDHRRDWTYSLIIPISDVAPEWKGAESYRLIHLAASKALNDIGIQAKLSGSDLSTGVAACFENPVCYDLVDLNGRKLAGAGQRRTKEGLLHQGSIATSFLKASDQDNYVTRFANQLSANSLETQIDIDSPSITTLIMQRYGTSKWLKIHEKFTG